MKTFLIFLAFAKSYGANVHLELVTELHRLEAKSEQVYLGDRLWSVNSGTDTIDVFSSRMQKLTSIRVPHSMTRMVGDGSSIVVFGKTQNPWRFYFTRIDATDYQQQTVTLPASVEIFPDEFIVAPNGELFLSDIPGRAVWRYQWGGRLEQIPVDIAVPTKLVKTGNSLYVVENFGLGSEVSNIVKIDLSSHAAIRLFSKRALPGKITDLLLLHDSKILAAPQVWKDKVVLIDTTTASLVKELDLAGNPRDIEQFGRCLIIASETSKKVSFVDWKTWNLVDSWDLTPAGDRLKLPGKISVDAVHGRVFARSTYPCMSCSVTQSSVFFAEAMETFLSCAQER